MCSDDNDHIYMYDNDPKMWNLQKYKSAQSKISVRTKVSWIMGYKG